MTLEDHIRSDEYKEEVAVVNLINPETGKRIDLVGAVHIGHPSYYEKVKEILSEADIVLYERITPSSEERTFRDNFLLINGLSLKGYYRHIADTVSGIHRARTMRAIDKVIEDLSPSEDQKSSLREYGQEISDELKLIYQEDAIHYENLPDNWVHADLTFDEVKAKTSILSKTNLMFGVMKIVVALTMRYQKLSDFIARKLITTGIISENIDKDSNASINREREKCVYNEIDSLNQRDDIQRVGIFYGAAHLPHLEEELRKRGYVRENINYVEAIRKEPIGVEMQEKGIKPAH